MSVRTSHRFSYCTGFLLAVAGGVICLLISMTGYAIYEEIAIDRRENKIRAVPFERLECTASGILLIGIGGESTPTLDADRQPLSQPLDEPLLKPAQIKRTKFEIRPVSHPDVFRDRNLLKRLDNQWDLKVKERWYFLVSDEETLRGYFVGYNNDSHRCLGYLGPDGFQETPPDKQFKAHPSILFRWAYPGFVQWNNLQQLYGDYNDSRILFRGVYPLNKRQILFHSERGLSLIDFRQKSIKPIIPGENITGLGWAGKVSRLPTPEENEIFGSPYTHLLTLFLVAETPDKVIFFQPDRNERLEFQLPDELSEGHNRYYLSADQSLIVLNQQAESPRSIEPGVGESTSDYFRILPTGKIAARKKIIRRLPLPVPGFDKDRGMNIVTLSVPGTLPSGLISGLFLPLVVREDGTTISAARRNVFSITWPALIASTILSAGLCVLVDRRQTACHLPRSYGWLLFVFLLGLPGFIGYRLHRKWPMKERPALPMPTGLEIFA